MGGSVGISEGYYRESVGISEGYYGESVGISEGYYGGKCRYMRPHH